MRIALGIEDHLDAFGRGLAAATWKVFAPDPLLWRADFLVVMNDPANEAFFNLKGIDDVWKSATLAARGGGGATDWELLQIELNPDWWPRITWWNDGVEVSNPF